MNELLSVWNTQQKLAFFTLIKISTIIISTQQTISYIYIHSIILNSSFFIIVKPASEVQHRTRLLKKEVGVFSISLYGDTDANLSCMIHLRALNDGNTHHNLTIKWCQSNDCKLMVSLTEFSVGNPALWCKVYLSSCMTISLHGDDSFNLIPN